MEQRRGGSRKNGKYNGKYNGKSKRRGSKSKGKGKPDLPTHMKVMMALEAKRGPGHTYNDKLLIELKQNTTIKTEIETIKKTVEMCESAIQPHNPTESQPESDDESDSYSEFNTAPEYSQPDIDNTPPSDENNNMSDTDSQNNNNHCSNGVNSLIDGINYIQESNNNKSIDTNTQSIIPPFDIILEQLNIINKQAVIDNDQRITAKVGVIIQQLNDLSQLIIDPNLKKLVENPNPNNLTPEQTIFNKIVLILKHLIEIPVIYIWPVIKAIAGVFMGIRNEIPGGRLLTNLIIAAAIFNNPRMLQLVIYLFNEVLYPGLEYTGVIDMIKGVTMVSSVYLVRALAWALGIVKPYFDTLTATIAADTALAASTAVTAAVTEAAAATAATAASTTVLNTILNTATNVAFNYGIPLLMNAQTPNVPLLTNGGSKASRRTLKKQKTKRRIQKI